MKSIKMLLLASFMIMLTACGDSSSVDTSADAPKTIAINKIMTYSEDQTQPVPTIKDYADAGAAGVTADNLSDVNTYVATLAPSEVDTPEKIQAIIDDSGFTIIDTTAPLIDIIGSTTINLLLNDTYAEPGVSCTDNYDATCTVVTGGATVDTTTPGNYIVTYDATDTAGNVATEGARTVNVLLAQESKLLSAGDRHTVEIKADGTLWAYGYNNHGQLGLGDAADRNTPIQIGSASNWVSVSGGDQFSVAINSSYELWAWGDNDYGQVYEWVTEP